MSYAIWHKWEFQFDLRISEITVGCNQSKGASDRSVFFSVMEITREMQKKSLQSVLKSSILNSKATVILIPGPL